MMKNLANVLRVVAPVILVSAMAGCGSSRSASLLEPEIGIEQLTSDSFIMQYQTRVSIEFRLEVLNRSGEPITLKRLELQTAGGRPYALRNAPEHFDLVIPPGEKKSVDFSMWGYSAGGRSASTEPVVLSGTAYFDTPGGRMAKTFIRRIQQPRDRRRD